MAKLIKKKKKYPLIMGAIQSSKWLIAEDALKDIVAIAQRANNETPEMLSERLGRPLENTQGVTVIDRTAVIDLTGPIFRYANLFTAISGGASIESFMKDFSEIQENSAIDNVILNIGSPGGQGDGIADAASIIRNSQKPVVAYIEANAQSAALWLAAAADEIVISRAAMMGSVGVVVTLNNNKEDGRIELVSSQSPEKRPNFDTNDGIQVVQTIVDDLAQVFIDDVASLRNISVESVLLWKGGTLVGRKAVAAGMADRIGDFESVLAGFSAGKSETRGVIAMSEKEKEKSSPEITQELIAGDYPAIANAFRNEGAVSERARIKAVEDQLMVGHEELIGELKYDGSTTGPEAAVAVLQAEKSKVKNMGEKMRSEAPNPASLEKEKDKNSNGIDPNLPLDVRAKSEWDTDGKLRDEFTDFDTYMAYKKAEESGRIRRIGGDK